MCLWRGNEFIFVCGREGDSKWEERRVHHPKFHSKGKRVTSWQANKQTKSTTAKRGRQTPQGMTKERARSIFLCEVEEKGYKEAKESTKRKKWREMVISISWNSEKRSEQQEICEWTREIHHLPQELQWQIHFSKSNEERASRKRSDSWSGSHFLPNREISVEQGELHLRGFSFEGQGKGKLEKTHEERPALMRKKGKWKWTRMRRDEDFHEREI